MAEKAREFAAEFGSGDWAYNAGWLHDLGKAADAFQAYLLRENGGEAHMENVPGRVDHSTAGAQYTVRALPIIGHLLAYAVAGHHAGLLDGRSENACQEKRLAKNIPALGYSFGELPNISKMKLPLFVKKALGEKDAFALAFFTRMIFSCLVDADFLDTERFMNPVQAAERLSSSSLGQLANTLSQSLKQMELIEPEKPINGLRHAVRLDCEKAAELPPSFFSLTVPHRRRKDPFLARFRHETCVAPSSRSDYLCSSIHQHY
ncbi:MAG: CRISPR-associated endonuclease Cas3'' [Kiritimatiellae bacterium]|nr:CRISPR-associated endonuclease Cas3'' [Kiritimatiellia bacterium]